MSNKVYTITLSLQQGTIMNFLDSLFTSETKSSNEKKLIDCVEKIDDSNFGVFTNIMNDLGSYVDKVGNNDTNMRKMGYAYARKMAAAGLCAQGIWGQEEFDYTCTLFKSFQLSTEHTVEFQENAAAQAIELIKSYDPRLTKELQVAITSVMMQDASIAKNYGKIFTVDEIIEIFKVQG